MEKINSFKELFDWIVNDWGFDRRNLEKHDDGTFTINKTYITPTELSYKTERAQITNPVVFRRLEQFYRLLYGPETKAEKVLYGQTETEDSES